LWMPIFMAALGPFATWTIRPSGLNSSQTNFLFTLTQYSLYVGFGVGDD
jgi:hypothetical protein